MSNYIIATDLDGVGYNFVDRFRLFVNEHTGKDLAGMPPAQTWNFFEDWGLSAKEYNEYVLEGLRQGFLFKQGEAIEGFKDAMEYFGKVRGDKIKIVTSRGFLDHEDIAYEATQTWLDANGIIYDEIVLADDKAAVDFDILIDDAPHHIEEVTITGRHALIFDQEWNRMITYPPRAKSWKQVMEYVDKYLPIFSSEQVVSHTAA